MLNSVLIANRGEIACRIIRTARKLGMRTIAVYSEADAHALHVELADEAYLIGPAPAAESYLKGDRIIEVAVKANAASIHPGYGFLSENAAFAQACADAGIVFVGPPPSAIRAMGLKDGAKAIMEKAGVPVVPGFHGEKQEKDFLKQKAYEIGYPVLIKAVAGGGGKGMRRVDKHNEFDAALESAKREARSAFGDDRVLIEKYVTAPRHIEVQVFADTKGNAVHLFERDCSLQRRHQKVIEEAPAPDMPKDLRAAMGQAAVSAALAVGYQGAGTVEFIADGSRGLRKDGFFFMEMNTRLQVEHPVTEAITGLDLVELQFQIAAGERLPFKQEQLGISGHAVEARLYAEDPENGFLPATGRLEALEFDTEGGIRIDAGVREGDLVTPFYDPMIAKIIAHGTTRDEALDKLAGALATAVVAGPRTNAAFLKALAENRDFRSGKFDTGLIDRNLDELLAAPAHMDEAVASIAAMHLLERAGEQGPVHSPWDINDSFQLGGPRRGGIELSVNGRPVSLKTEWRADGVSIDAGDGWPEADAAVVDAADGVYVIADARQYHIRRPDYGAIDLEAGDGDAFIRAPMHGKLLSLFVEKGQAVRKGDRLAIVEAMKMEHSLIASRDGTVSDITASVGDQVGQGDRLITIHSED